MRQTSNSQTTQPETISRKLIVRIVERLSQGKRVHTELPQGGVVHIDRKWPMLVVYRYAARAKDEAVAELIHAGGSYLMAPWGWHLCNRLG